MSDLLNRTRVREFILDTTKRVRPGWTCTRVSEQALDQINARLRALVIQMIESHPTLGKTFKP